MKTTDIRRPITKRKCGEIWKDEGEYKIQMPKGIWTTKTREEAEYMATLIIKPVEELIDEFMEALNVYVDVKIYFDRSYREDAEYASTKDVTEAGEELTKKLAALLKK